VPCFACGVRQTDPERGPSAWKRLVRHGEQVLVCPECSRTPNWDADADQCEACGSRTLSKSLGMIRCKGCGAVTPAASGDQTPAVSRSANDLSADVAGALDRLFGRTQS
jgi:hypothetical protein